MAVEETTLDVSGNGQPGGSPDPGGSSPSTTAEPNSSANVTTATADPSQSASEPADPLAGVPTLEEAQNLQTISREAFLSVRGEYDKVKPQYEELSTKYKTFEPIAERFQTPEEVQEVVRLHETLNKYSRAPSSGELLPDPSEFVQDLVTKDPIRADILNGQLLWSQVQLGTDQRTGQPVMGTRAEAFYHALNDPDMREERSKVLQILGAVEQSQVPAPTWTPSQDELDRLALDPTRPTPEEKALQDQYKKLSYEERDELKLASPEFVRSTLRTLQQNQMLQANEERRVQAERQAQAQAEQRMEQEATAAGEQFVETGFREGLSNFANHLYETYKPTDDDAVNRREAGLTALAVVSLSHPDTRWAGEQLLKEMGVSPQDIEPLNKARESYANSARQHGYLTHKKMRTTGDPSRDQQRLIAQAKSLATKITVSRDAYFRLRAADHNRQLDQAGTARIPVGGSAPANGRVPPQAGRHPWMDI